MNAVAYVNHGRWVIDCPGDGCYAALKATDTGVVCDCMDEVVCDHPTIPHGLAIDILFPDTSDDITRLLDLRPRRINRNWYPGETLDDLKAENVTHGAKI